VRRSLDAEDGTFSDWPGLVAAGVVSDTANRTQKLAGYHLPGRRRGHGEDSIQCDESRNREAVSSGMLPSKAL
jgi:hypothetical protein